MKRDEGKRKGHNGSSGKILQHEESVVGRSAKQLTRFNMWKVSTILFVVCTLMCLGSFFVSSRNYNELVIQYVEVNKSYVDLQGRYASITNEYQNISLKHQILESEYSILIDNYSDLNKRFQSMDPSHVNAFEDRQQLLSALDNVNNCSQRVFDDISIRIPNDEQRNEFVTIDDSQVEGQVMSTTGGWDGTVEDFWSDISRMYEWMTSYVEYSHDTYTPELSLNVHNLNLSTCNFSLKILGFSNIHNSYWVKDFWKFPNETLSDRCGDCEDMAVLLASMIRCYCTRYARSPHQTYAMLLIGPGSAHAVVMMQISPGKIVVLDPVTKYISKFSSPQAVADEIADYLSYRHGQYTNVECVFNETTYKTFTNLSEFISYFADQ